MPKIKFDKELFEKVKKFAEDEGYSSIEECISTILEREITQSSEEDNDEDVLKRMKGLGYIS